MLPPDLAKAHKAGFFPGSTIGNFPPLAARRLLRLMRHILLPQGRLIIGVDLKKDIHQLLRAYNDSSGVTAAFNLNLLARINRELEGNFNLDCFRHEAIYNHHESRVEMHLVCSKDQAVRIRDRWFRFSAGETIHTENCYKYSVSQFRDLARTAGWLPGRVWSDAENLFSVHELINTIT
jgi:dimethylhistidine N-methyltransferase